MTKKNGNCSTSLKPLSIPEAGNRLHMIKLIDAVEKLQLNQKQTEFVSAFVVAYNSITRVELAKTDRSRVGLTFQKVEDLLGTDAVNLFRKDWSQAKEVFCKTIARNSLKSCMDKVAAERRRERKLYASTGEQVSNTIGDYVGQLEDLKKDLLPA